MESITLWLIALTVYVTKFDGTMQPFDRKKVVKTCLRMGAAPAVAESIAEEIKNRVYNGMETKKKTSIG